MKRIKTTILIGILILFSGCGSENVHIDTLVERDVGTEHIVASTHFTSVNSTVRGIVALEVYLPPSWDKSKQGGYPVIFFLHGGSGNETSFFNHVEHEQLNTWINQGDVSPFLLIAIESEYVGGEEGQWSSPNNEVFLTSEEAGELREFVRTNYNAGYNSQDISIHGQSRGARGALHYAFKFPTKFSSAMSNAFVSDYALEEEKDNALKNIDNIADSGIKIRMVIGTEDNWVLEEGRQASYVMHDYLTELNIAHEFEILQDAGHQLNSIWVTPTENGMINGLYELKLHAQMWQH
ncbi:MAG: enterochelin esterase-like enzyme [Alteromonadaceae bacterium]|jgi:enterochelin esterase-like enzyme